ncbi:MAG: flagellar protein FlaG [Pseudomonadota bacterium]|nr:flagellar protein FlaG [Pseudomonadota bacterium]
MDINNILSSAAANQSSQSVEKPTVVMETKQQQSESSVVSPASNTQSATLLELSDKAEQLNQQMELLGQSLAFRVDEGTQSPVVSVVDKTTDEVIRQFPSEGSLRIMQNIQNYLNSVQQSGLQAKEGLTGSLFNEII